jgi:hypothetical protein
MFRVDFAGGFHGLLATNSTDVSAPESRENTEE